MNWEIQEKSKKSLNINKNKLLRFIEIIDGCKFIVPDIGFSGECEDIPINFIFNFYLKNIIYYKSFKLLNIYDNIEDKHYNDNIKNIILNNGYYYDLSKKLNLIKTESLVSESFWF